MAWWKESTENRKLSEGKKPDMSAISRGGFSPENSSQTLEKVKPPLWWLTKPRKQV